MDDITTLALVLSPLIKLTVDLLRTSWPASRPWSATIAIAVGMVVAEIALVAMGEVMTPQTVARGLLAGLMAAGGAVLLTEGQKTANRNEKRS